MKSLVCIKQVPDMESRFTLNGDETWYDSTDLAWRMNEYDEFSVEEAVATKEKLGNGEVTVLCIGPDRVKETMKKALAMGCDRGVHVVDEEYHRKDPFEIASIIAAYAKDEAFDLIFCGMQSQDRGSGQVGVLLGEILGVNTITTLVGFSMEGNEIEVRRELEGGIKAIVKAPTPALVTCQLGLNTPRYPTLPNIMKAKKKELLSVAVSDLLEAEGLQQTTRLAYPEKQGGGLVLEGGADELADQLIAILKEKTSVLV